VSVKGRFQERAAAWLQRSEQDINAALDVMLANHSAAGRLQSGNTIIRAVEIFDEETSKALTQCLDEAAKLIDHRGWRWAGQWTALVMPSTIISLMPERSWQIRFALLTPGRRDQSKMQPMKR
jgi:hypothetical protein